MTADQLPVWPAFPGEDERRVDAGPGRAEEPLLDPDRPPRRRRTAGDIGLAVVGVVGEILITLGILLGLFIAWQLWWTDVVALREQDEALEDLGWAQVEPAEPVAEPSLERRDAAPVMDQPPLLTDFATVQVPRWGPDYVTIVREGTGKRDVLDLGRLGHYEDTAMPGEIGNFAVAGHRTTYGKPLHYVEELQVDDAIVVQTEDTWYVYRMTSAEIVRPSQVEVIAPVPGAPEDTPTAAMMTLTTCHPMFSARERFIVYAELDYWMPVADGTPAELTGGS